jgi:hypothetical protein
MAGNLEAAILIILNTKRVLPAIELDHQLRCGTGEIHNVPPNRMLTTKSVREP